LNLKPRNGDAAPKQRTLIEQFQQFSVGLLGGIAEGDLLPALGEHRVLLAVEGSRRFRHAKSLGMWPYDGCHVFVFDKDLGAAGKRLKSILEDAGATVKRIGRHEAFQISEKQEQDLWTYLVMHPRPNIIVVTTHRGILEEFVNRMDADERSHPRAMPADLPEWKHVDVDAPVWSIRHYRREFMEGDETNALHGGDEFNQIPGATGLVMQFSAPVKGRHSARLAWITEAHDAIARVTNDSSLPVSEEKVLKPVPAKSQLGGVTAEWNEVDSTGLLLFYCLAALGHAINL
jgi:hypothetical protein